MKGMKREIPGFLGRVGRTGRPSLCISPLATNDSPLDHARRAAGGKLQVKTVPPDFGQCEGLGVDSRKQTEAV